MHFTAISLGVVDLGEHACYALGTMTREGSLTMMTWTRSVRLSNDPHGVGFLVNG